MHNLLISLSLTTQNCSFDKILTSDKKHFKKSCLFDEITTLKLALFSSPVAHGTAVTFQWTCLCYGFAKPLPPTFLCYGFAKSIQYASPCCCMCESLIRPIRTHYTSYNHTVGARTQFATTSGLNTSNTIQHISVQILLHCVLNMIWPFRTPTNIFQ